MRRLPDFIVIGAMKCATSSLHNRLAAQKGIFMSEPKEPCFFSDDEIYDRGIDWYSGLFAEAGEDDLCGESSTHYTKLPTCPETLGRMREHLPDARLVYVMRHPVDRLVSHYVHDWSERKITDPIDEAVETHRDLVDYGLYAMQLAPYLEAFGPGRILPVFFERLVADPGPDVERICRFLGLDGEVRLPDQGARDNVSSKRLRRSPVRDAIVWNPVVTWLRRHLVPRGARDWVKGFWQMKGRPELSDESLARLTAVFDDDLARLGDWLGSALHCGNFKEIAASETPSWKGIQTP